MLATNIETNVKEILEKKGKGGWLRVSECAKLYAKDDASKETKFYRWRKQIEKDKVKGFQILSLPGNIVYIGLESANPNNLIKTIMEDPEAKKKFRFLGRFRRKKENAELFGGGEMMALSHFLQHETRYARNFAKLYIWLKRGAKPEEKPQLEE